MFGQSNNFRFFASSGTTMETAFTLGDIAISDQSGFLGTTSVSIFGINVSTVETLNQDIIVYPNPANNAITIKGLKDGTDIKITDFYGNKILHAELGKPLDISRLLSGIYFIMIEGNNTLKFEKL